MSATGDNYEDGCAAAYERGYAQATADAATKRLLAGDTSDAVMLAVVREERDTLFAALEKERTENASLREFIAASEACAKAEDLVEVYEENERYRQAFNEMIGTLQESGTVKGAFCTWCGEQWPKLDGETIEVTQEAARRHLYRCAKHPLKIERDVLLEQETALRAALREACDLLRAIPFGVVDGELITHRSTTNADIAAWVLRAYDVKERIVPLPTEESHG